MITDTLTAIKYLLKDDYPELIHSLNSPVSEMTIEKMEARTGLVLPEEIKTLYRMHNGEAGQAGFFFGLPFISLETALQEWEIWSKLANSTSMLDSSVISVPEEYIQEQYASRNYIPISKDDGGNHIGVDLAPGEKGVYGQVINFGRDEDTRYVIANSLDEFLNFMLDHIRNGNYIIQEEEEGGRSFLMKTPSNEHFLDTLPYLPLPYGTEPPVVDGGNIGYNAWYSSLDENWKAGVGAGNSFQSLAGVKSLKLTGKNITGLQPVQYYTGLRELMVSSNPFSDLSPVASLKELKKLFAAKTKVADISPVLHLKNLTELSLSETEISSVKGLEQLKKLSYLSVQRTKLPSLADVCVIKSLTKLDISYNQFDSFEELGNLTKLAELQLADTNVRDISFILRLNKLTQVAFGNTSIEDLKPLIRLPNLEYITCCIEDFLRLKDQSFPKKIHFIISGNMSPEQEKIYAEYSLS